MSHSNKRVLIVTSNFYPEFSGIAAYSSDLAFEIISKEDDVTVLTTYPHYPWRKIPNEFAHITSGETNSTNVRTIRVKHYIPKKLKVFNRVLSELSFFIMGGVSLMKTSEKFNLVIAIMPSVSSGLLARVLAKRQSVNGLVIFQDLSFAALSQSSLTNSKFLIYLAKSLEAFSSRWASEIIAISPQMAKSINENLMPKSKVRVIYNYSLIEKSFLNSRDAKIKLGFDPDKFLIIHSGNIGFKQDLINVVEAGRLLFRNEDVEILIIGQGNLQHQVSEAIALSPSRTFYSSFVPNSDYPIYLQAADALLINEKSTLKEMSLPSKVTSYAVANKPIIAAISDKSATFELLRESAFIVRAGSPLELAAAIIELKSNSSLRSELVDKIQRLSLKHFDSFAARLRYREVISSLLNK